MPTRRRGGLPRSRKALLDYPQFLRVGPSTAPTGVNNLKATDMATVIMAIHNDSQLPAKQFRKAAHTEGIPSARPSMCWSRQCLYWAQSAMNRRMLAVEG